MKATEKKKGIICECGGHLQPATLKTHDFSAAVGFKVTLRGVAGLRCDKCGYETIDGRLINHVLGHMLVEFLRSPERLNKEEARYLRRMLGATQEELATRMGVDRVTVAKWETGEHTISPQHDFILRCLSLNRLVTAGRIRKEEVDAIFATMRSVHAQPPKEETSVDLSGMTVGRRRRAKAGA